MNILNIKRSFINFIIYTSCFLFVCTVNGFAQSDDNILEDRVQITDEYHYSTVFSGNRLYRIFLPPDYKKDENKRYPVIYYLHGWAQRHLGRGDPDILITTEAMKTMGIILKNLFQKMMSL